MSLDYNKIREENLVELLAIRDNPDTPQSVKIQAIQSIQKIIQEAEPTAEKTTSESDILGKIRGAKK